MAYWTGASRTLHERAVGRQLSDEPNWSRRNKLNAQPILDVVSVHSKRRELIFSMKTVVVQASAFKVDQTDKRDSGFTAFRGVA